MKVDGHLRAGGSAAPDVLGLCWDLGPHVLCAAASASRWGRGVRPGRRRDTHRHLRPRSSGVCGSSRLQEAELPGPPRRLRPPRPPGSPPALRPVPPHTAPPPGCAVAPLPEPSPPRRSLLPSCTVPSAPRAPAPSVPSTQEVTDSINVPGTLAGLGIPRRAK